MPVLNVKTKRIGFKLVGVSVSPRVHEYLTLYTLAKGSTKTKIFKKLLEDWILEKQEKETETELLRAIVQRVNTQWKIEKSSAISTTTTPFKHFKEDLEAELIDKGVSPIHIEKILTEIKQ